jgi:hypothetical protein
VTWLDGELWHATWEGGESELRRIDPRTGEVLERLQMPPDVSVSGLESDRNDQFLLRRRTDRKGEGRPPTEGSLSVGRRMTIDRGRY